MRRIAEYVWWRTQQIVSEWLEYRLEVDPNEERISFEVFSRVGQHRDENGSEEKAAKSWSTDRHEVLFTEAKRVIEAQNGTLSDIDDKAMRTVHFNTLIIGILLSAAELGDLELLTSNLVFWGGVALFFSLILGVVTYFESRIKIGPKRNYLEELVDENASNEPWDEDLIKTMAVWIDRNGTITRWNRWVLAGSQLLLIVGLGLISYGVISTLS